MIQLRNISVSFDGEQVINDLSLDIKKGEICLVGGESGIGKTTLLRVIAGLLKPNSGSISIEGRTAIMFQEPRLLPWKNSLENVKAVLKAKDSALAEKYLSLAGLENDLDKYPSELSGGMAQRVSFARFAAFSEETNAEILLLDEPFSSLDTENKEKMLSLLLKPAKGKTLLIVSHEDISKKIPEARIIGL